MLDIQLGRRNLSTIQRIAVVKKFEKKIQEQAKAKLVESGKLYGENHPKDKSLSPNGETLSDKKIHTDKELAKLAGVSREADNKGKEQQETLKEVESKLAEKRLSIFGSTGGRGNKKGVPDSAQGLEEQKKGKARDKAAKNVGLRSGKKIEVLIREI